MTSLFALTLLALGGGPVARAAGPASCETTLAAEITTLNFLWDTFERMRRGELTTPTAPDFHSYAEARRFLDGLIFVPDFGHARQPDAEAVETFVSWRFERRRDALEDSAELRRYALAPVLAELAEYMTKQKFAPFLGHALGHEPRWRLDFRVQPHLPKGFWPMVWSTVQSGVLFEEQRGVLFLKYNGFVHVLQPEGEGERVDYAVYKIANRANVSGPLHFAYFLELLYHHLGPPDGALPEMQDLFFHRYPRLRVLLIEKT